MHVDFFQDNPVSLQRLRLFNPWAYKDDGGVGGGGGGRERGTGCHPHKVFLEFFKDEFLSPLAVFSSCAHISYTHFDTRLVSIGCYGYEI